MITSSAMTDVVVLYEHPEWQKPLFAALERNGLSFEAYDLKRGVFDPAALPEARVVFNQASPSAYVRGHDRAVPFALSLLRAFEATRAEVVNGHSAFALELSKSAQIALLRSLGFGHPETLVFDDFQTLAERVTKEGFPFPALLKPDQGGSGARMFRVESLAEVEALVAEQSLWEPDPVLLLQEQLNYDTKHGVVRLEVAGGELLYAMRIVTDGQFNLCPSEVCNPSDRPAGPSFFPYPEVSKEAIEQAVTITRAAGLDIAGLEYALIEGQPVFYDINANSNLRPEVAKAYRNDPGYDPFQSVVDVLKARLRFASQS